MYKSKSKSYLEHQANMFKCKNSHKGYIGLMCDECYSYRIEKCNYSILYQDAYNDDDQDDIFDASMQFTFKCKCCGKRVTVEYPLDPNITKTLSILNKKGYTTLFSCEGDTGERRAYIYFKHDYQKIIMHYYRLPIPWYFDNEINTYGDYASQKFIIRAAAGVVSDQARIDYIEEWAEELPVWSKFAKQYGYALVGKYAGHEEILPE